MLDTDDEMLAISEKVCDGPEDVDQFHGEQSIRFVVSNFLLVFCEKFVKVNIKICTFF